MFGGKASKPQNRIDSLIGDGTTVEGNVMFTGGLRIDGRVKGNVLARDDQPSTLVLSERARVEGEIRVSHAVINGTVVGPVYGSRVRRTATKMQGHRGCALPHAGDPARRGGAGSAGASGGSAGTQGHRP